MSIAPALTIGLLLLPALSLAQAIKCVDKEGRTTYSDQACGPASRSRLIDTTPAGELDNSSVRNQVGRLKTQPPPVPAAQGAAGAPARLPAAASEPPAAAGSQGNAKPPRGY
jgi:hypothetical protein